MQEQYDENVIPSMGWQLIKALPVVPSGQVHIGIWLYTLHCAVCPHADIHGSSHLFLIQALFIAHSIFDKHSGLQPK